MASNAILVLPVGDTKIKDDPGDTGSLDDPEVPSVQPLLCRLASSSGS